MEQAVWHVRCIREGYPDLVVRTVRLLDTEAGQYNNIVVLNDDLIFRFPRFPEGLELLEREVALLSAIQDRVTLAVPAPLYVNLLPREVGRVFCGYRLIPGEPLQRDLVATLDEATLVRIAGQLTGFLRELHAVPVAELLPGLPRPDWRLRWESLFQRLREAVWPHLEPAVREQLRQEFARFLTQQRNFAFTPALIHGDFATGNILFDPHAGAVTGVIDFGSAGLGDPALDYATLLVYGEEFARHCIAAYPAIGEAAALERARFYHRTFALQEALYGVEHGNRAALERGLGPLIARESGGGA